ncbi:alpha-ribazole phosphatase [Bacteroidota bacterium]
MLYLLRHTKVNTPTGVCYGQTDVELFSTFENEKNTLLDKCRNIKFDKIYSSPLKRCSLLAEAFAISPDGVFYDKRLIEMNFGCWEGKKWDEIEKSKEAKIWFKNYINTACPEGEAYTDLLLRVQNFIDDLKKNDPDKNLLIVSHSGTIRAFYSILNKIHPKEVFEIEIDFGQLIEMELN